MSSDEIQIAKRWVLKTCETGELVVVDSIAHDVIRAEGKMTIYPSWGVQSARAAVKSYFGNKHHSARLTKAQKRKVEEFCKKTSKTKHLHFRISSKDKKAFEKQAMAEGIALSKWVLARCREGIE